MLWMNKTSTKTKTSKTFDFGVEHAGQTVSIDFDMYEIGSWDSHFWGPDGNIEEAFTVYINEEQVIDDAKRQDGDGEWDEHYGIIANTGIDISPNIQGNSDEKHPYTLQATLDDAISVKALGAVGDDSTADVAAIQRALDLSLIHI